VFDQAIKIQGCINLDGKGYQACIYLGVKISRDDLTKQVKIYDPQKSLNYYVEVDKGLYKLFLDKGWKDAVIQITLEKYKQKLEKVKESISKEIIHRFIDGLAIPDKEKKRLRDLTPQNYIGKATELAQNIGK